MVEYIRSLGWPPKATVLGCGFRTDLHHAAFLNGTTAEAIEAQDGLRFGGNHPGTAVIPVALAVAEDMGLGGKAIIEAVVVGYEAANRPAAAMHPWHTLGGFLPTGTCGTFGAAAAAARLKVIKRPGDAERQGVRGLSGAHIMGSSSWRVHRQDRTGRPGRVAGLMAAGLPVPAHGVRQEFGWIGAEGGFTKSRHGRRQDREADEGLGGRYTISDI